jgi:hypothetical protein
MAVFETIPPELRKSGCVKINYITFLTFFTLVITMIQFMYQVFFYL